MSLIGRGYAIDLLCKLYHHNSEEKNLLHEDQETLMVDVLNLQANIGRGGRDEERDDKVVSIWEGIIILKKISRQGTSLALQDK